MPGLYYEDFAEGRSWTTPSRALGEAEVMAFAELSGDRTYLHTDAEAAARGPFGERVAHGLLGLSVLSGLMINLGIVEGTVEAFLGLAWRFTGPIRFGDQVRGEIPPRGHEWEAVCLRVRREVLPPHQELVNVVPGGLHVHHVGHETIRPLDPTWRSQDHTS